MFSSWNRFFADLKLLCLRYMGRRRRSTYYQLGFASDAFPSARLAKGLLVIFEETLAESSTSLDRKIALKYLLAVMAEQDAYTRSMIDSCVQVISLSQAKSAPAMVRFAADLAGLIATNGDKAAQVFLDGYPSAEEIDLASTLATCWSAGIIRTEPWDLDASALKEVASRFIEISVNKDRFDWVDTRAQGDD